MLFQDPSDFVHQHLALSVGIDTKSYVGISERPESADATKPPTSLSSSTVHLNEKALTKPRPRMHASGKFGGTSLLEETSSSSQSQTAHFLKACGFCKCRLIPGCDIYMHRSDTAFCSLEYRQQDKPEDAETRENKTFKPAKLYKVLSRCELPSQEASSNCQHFIMCAAASIATVLTIINILAPSPIWADDKSNGEEENDGVIGAFKTLFDPNEKTKSRKVLPNAYLKSAKEVLKTLHESLNEDTKDNAKF
ncbi:hypothetical protein ACFX1Q_032150 [Malus domestica]